MGPPRSGQAPLEQAGEKGKKEKKRRLRAGQIRLWVPDMAASVDAMSAGDPDNVWVSSSWPGSGASRVSNCRCYRNLPFGQLFCIYLFTGIHQAKPALDVWRPWASCRHLAALRAGFRQDQKGIFSRAKISIVLLPPAYFILHHALGGAFLSAPIPRASFIDFLFKLK